MLRIVKTENGQVEGILAADPRITAFKGIPFAAPPVGQNRWRAPQPCEDWEGVRKAYSFAPISVQDTPGIGDNLYNREWQDVYKRQVLVYRLILPKETDVHKTYMQLKDIEEEEPQLSIVWNEKLNEINIRLMGEIQTEVLKRIIRERLDINVEFDTGNIVYLSLIHI